MNGIVVAGQPGLTLPPSQHYTRTIGGTVDGVSPQFRTLVGRLIDGERATPSGSRQIYALYGDSRYARVLACDRSAEKCFVIDIAARIHGDALGHWHPQRPHPPVLLYDILIGGAWQLYNCRIALQEWSLSAVERDRLLP